MVIQLYTEIPGQYLVGKEHLIDEQDQILYNAISALNNTAMKFSKDAISDSQVRQNYVNNIRRMSQEVRELVNSKQLTVKDGAEFCYKMRNQIMAEHRKFTSTHGVAIAEKYKKAPPVINNLLDEYAQRKFKVNFQDLTRLQKNTIYYELIESSGRNNINFSTKVKRLNVLGKVGILVTASLATYEILNAQNKTKETIKQGLGIGGAFAGGWLAALGVSSICGPGAPLCALAVVFIGSIGGSMIGSAVADSLDDEIEEFTKWNIF